ncbi:MAG TPA: hypothetical protein PKD51_04085 [Saprospiraceae bacterium]|nr:hypothetical protein [Saprospiraceae bacterium]
MDKILNIAYAKGQNLEAFVSKHLTQLADLGYEIVIIPIEEPTNESTQKAFSMIKNGKVDFAIFHLSDLHPIYPADDLIIAALSERHDAQDCLVINEDCYGPSEELRLKAGSTVHVSSIIQSEQLKKLNPSINVVISNKDIQENIDLLNSGSVNAVILPKVFADKAIFTTPVKLVNLHPKEMIPAPGQGTFGFVTLTENIKIRRILKPIHEKETAEMTNVERTIKHLIPENSQPNIVAYCYKDKSSNFHALGSFYNTETSTLRFASHSQSTSNGLAEIIFNSLYHK